ncbi:MAG: hypothetical protein GY842_12575, partial [bacterium]|nr:hypothetical protein [bacterium]
PPPPFTGERSPDEWRRWFTEHLPTMAGESRGNLLGGFAFTRQVSKGWWGRLCGSPLRRSFAIAQRLRHRGLPALHVPVLLERRSVGDSEWVLAVHQPSGAVRLHEIASTLLSAPAEQPVPPAARRRRLSELLTATGHLAAAMVDGGVIARRLGLDAFVVVPARGDSPERVCIREFESLTLRRRAVRAAADWMPACLWQDCPTGLTRSDRLRFLLAYWHHLPPQVRPICWKALWRQIAATDA